MKFPVLWSVASVTRGQQFTQPARTIMHRLSGHRVKCESERENEIAAKYEPIVTAKLEYMKFQARWSVGRRLRVSENLPQGFSDS